MDYIRNLELIFLFNFLTNSISRMSKGIGDANLLQKRIPRSARYRNVRGRVDTGYLLSLENYHLEFKRKLAENYCARFYELSLIHI